MTHDQATVIYNLIKDYDDEVLKLIEAAAGLKLLHQKSRKLQDRFSVRVSDEADRHLATLEKISDKRLEYQTLLLRSQTETKRLRGQFRQKLQ